MLTHTKNEMRWRIPTPITFVGLIVIVFTFAGGECGPTEVSQPFPAGDPVPFASVVPGQRPPLPRPVMTGDVDGDGQLGLNDIASLTSILMRGPSSDGAWRADVNRDGRADGRDIQSLVDTFLHAHEIGACCVSAGTCRIAPEEECAARFGGTYQGHGTTCGSPCPSQPSLVLVSASTPPPYCNTPGSVVYFTVTGRTFTAAATAHLVNPNGFTFDPFLIEVVAGQALHVWFELDGTIPGTWQLVVTPSNAPAATGGDPVQVINCL